MSEPNKWTAFPDAFGSPGWECPPPRTLNELLMVRLSASIREKPEWWKKYTNPEIRARWREEMLDTKMVWIERATMLVSFDEASNYFTAGQRNNLDESVVELGEDEVDYVLDELEGYAKLREEKTGIQVSCFDGIWHSDGLISSDLRERLKKGVAVLEDVPDSEKDWHPGSNEQVLDLVHPSLHCIVYGRTLAVPRAKDGTAQTNAEARPVQIPATLINAGVTLKSTKFSWLPTDFSVSTDGRVKALGYINNLHPSHTELYSTIEDILGAFVPLFDRVLTDLQNPLEAIPQRLPGNYRPLSEIDSNYPTNEDDDDYYEQVEEYMENTWEEMGKPVALPLLPEGGYTGGREKRTRTYSLLGRTIQVIVKLANIHLTPEKPEYKGGTWHVEGMANERIVASGIYYYDQENITGSELAFRIAVDEPDMAKSIQADTYDYHAHFRTWGMEMDYSKYVHTSMREYAYLDRGLDLNFDSSTKLNNVVGATPTKEGRCLAFPNVYQHRVSPFKLADSQKPGHRKILAFFLVDPNIQELLPSTTIVPPQQHAWVRQALHETGSESLLRRLPIELFDVITDQAGPEIMGLEEAKKIREELMDERRRTEEYAESMDEMYSRVFNLCEH